MDRELYQAEKANLKSKKGTWRQALFTFLTPIFLVLCLRWLLIEPFIIPSGSMIPSLLVHDHILVNKLAYGIRVPFMDAWLVHWQAPQRGDIVVFKYPLNPQIYYIKRLIGLPGDEIIVNGHDLFINGQKVLKTALAKSVKSENLATSEKLLEEVGTELEDSFDYFREEISQNSHRVRFYKEQALMAEELDSVGHVTKEAKFKVPLGEYFFMGDNRDQSSDGRVWGFVPHKYIVGRASLIWLSCENMLESANFACDPSTLRWKRLLRLLH